MKSISFICLLFALMVYYFQYMRFTMEYFLKPKKNVGSDMSLIRFIFNLWSEIVIGIKRDKLFIPLLVICGINLILIIYYFINIIIHESKDLLSIASSVIVIFLNIIIIIIIPLWLFLKRSELHGYTNNDFLNEIEKKTHNWLLPLIAYLGAGGFLLLFYIK